MSRGLYAKLAWSGIKKNKQLYYPYLISGIAMVMAFYILSFLGASNVVRSLKGGAAVTQMLSQGSWIIGIFSLFFLFYTNSSLIKKRKKEFGLYNILGMNKSNILVILLWETLFTYGIVIVIGVLAGILCSKVAELGIVNIMGAETDYRIYFDGTAVIYAVLLFAVIYVLLFLNILRQIRTNNPIELLRSESAGERPPKSRWLLAVISVVLLIAAYCMLMKADYHNYDEIIQTFAATVLLIIIGTYFLFIAGSVFLCKVLQNDKGYYYRASHFVTVSSMSYRMKRNGASLASICILSTMILILLAGSINYYAGVNHIIDSHYPYDINVTIDIPLEDMTDIETASETYKEVIDDTLQQKDAKISGSINTYSVTMLAPVIEGLLDMSVDVMDTWNEQEGINELEKQGNEVIGIRVISIDDYNTLCKTEETLDDGEVLLASENAEYDSEHIIGLDGTEFHVSETTKEIPNLSAVKLYGNNYLDASGIDLVYLVVSDMTSFFGMESSLPDTIGSREMASCLEYDINMQEDYDRQLEIYHALETNMQQACESQNLQDYHCSSRAESEDNMHGLTGGLMFLAVIISIVLVFIATLIMYYKQISEGYEDQKRFLIMQKIGMTKKEIRSSINSQMLTVFYFPLIIAGIHLIFMLPLIHQIMKTVMLDNWDLLVKVTVISYILFAVVYSLVYLLTTRSYSRIVNRASGEA